MDSPASSADDTASSWIDRQCDQFEKDWRDGRNPRIEDILAGLPAEVHAVALRELVAVELELRRRRGDQIYRDEYLQRFPESVALLDEFSASFAVEIDATSPLGELDGAPTSTTTSTRYRDLRFYRRGGLGSLYRARDESLHRETVVKFMNEQCEADPALIAQFKIEAEVTSRLDHPGIVPVYGTGQDWLGRPFYVMRLINGRELKEAIQDFHSAGGPTKRGLRNRQLLFTLLEHLASACNTVAYAHHVGIVHCDIKPANIMIGKYGETFVLDWGLATSFERTSTFLAPNEATVRPHAAAGGSTSGRRGGTYGYISPEQLGSDAPLGPASDVYSLGATLYEILTGQPPFSGQDPEVREKIRLGRFVSPRGLQPGLCPRLDAICQKAMKLDPTARYATAKQLADDLANWMRDEEVQARPDKWFDQVSRFGRRHRGLTAAFFISLLTIVVALGWTDRIRKMGAHERALREAGETSFTTALDTFEDLCRPLANGEMSNLGVFRPLVDKIKNFTTVYLQNFEHMEAMRLHTGRVYELRGTVSRVYSSDTAQAIEDFQRAEKLYKQLPASQEEHVEHELRLAHVRLSQGRMFIQRDEFPKAQGVLELATEALKGLSRQAPENTLLSRHLAEAYHCLGEMHLDKPAEGSLRAQALLDAETNFNQSKALREKLVKSTTGEESRNHQRDLARSLGYLGDLYLAQGDVPRAAQAYEQSRKLREGLYRTNPRDPEQRFQYARGLGNFGDLERGYRGELDSAIEQLTKAREIQRELTNDFDEVENFWIDLGGTENMLAEICLFASLDDPTMADAMRQRCREAAEQAGEVYGRLSRQSNPRGRRGLAQSSVILAILTRDTDPSESRRLAREAEQSLDSLGPESLLSGRELVTLAMARSLLGQPGAALVAFQEGIKRGENSAYRFERHADLAFKNLAGDPKFGPQFRALVKQVRESLKSN